MKERDENLIAIRPAIPRIETGKEYTDIERFQNQTLRPILKMQHDLLFAFFDSYCVKRKTKFREMTTEKQEEQIQHWLSKDISFRQMILGLVIGQFILEEYRTYLDLEPEASRRIRTMAGQRIMNAYKHTE